MAERKQMQLSLISKKAYLLVLGLLVLTMVMNFSVAASPKAATQSFLTYKAKGIYAPRYVKGQILIESSGVTIQNTIVDGNITISSKVGSGTVKMKNVVVRGQVIIRGGKSFDFSGVTFNQCSVVNRNNMSAIVFTGPTTVKQVSFASKGKITINKSGGTGIDNVIVTSSGVLTGNVSLVGSYKNVNIKAPKSQFALQSGSVENIEVYKGASNAYLGILKSTNVGNLRTSASITIEGTGRLRHFRIGSSDLKIMMQRMPLIDQISIENIAYNSEINLTANTTVAKLRIEAPVHFTGEGTIVDTLVAGTWMGIYFDGALKMTNVVIDGYSTGTNVDIGYGTSISELGINSAASVTGSGQIETVRVNANGVTVNATVKTLVPAKGVLYASTYVPITDNAYTVTSTTTDFTTFIYGLPITLVESDANDGNLASGVITLNVYKGQFLPDISKTNVVVNNLPAGMDYLVTYVDSTHVKVTLSGTALKHTNSDDANITITISDGKVMGASGTLSTGNVLLDFKDPEQIVAVDTDVTLTTATPYTALTDSTARLTLTKGTLLALISSSDLTVTGLPSGLSVSAVKGSGNEIDITVSGTANQPIPTGTTFTVVIKASAVIDKGAMDSIYHTITINQQ